MLRALLIVAPALAVMAVAAGTAAALGRRRGSPAEQGRLASLDGLRGYLALGVFVHHATLWRAYVQPGHAWFPRHPIPLYIHIGQSAVTAFFLMTGFLFGGKLAEGRVRPVNWTRLYVSRLLRIYPLYGVALAGVLVAVAALGGTALRVPPATFARSVLAWAHFARPDLNGVPATWVVIAGVTWSLAYEWLFYAALPLAALAFGVRPPVPWLLAGTAGVALWWHWIAVSDNGGVRAIFLTTFAAGVLVSVVTRSVRVRALLGGPAAACVAIAATVAVPLRYAEPYQLPVVALLTVAFAPVAAGNTIFGLLRLPASRLLGEISYSIYLLHGLLLFGILRGVLGVPMVAALSTGAYWGLVLALTPVLVVGAFASYRLVERPCIGMTPHAQRWVAERVEASRTLRRLARRGWGRSRGADADETLRAAV